MSSTPPVEDCSIQGQDRIDHLHPECPVCRRPDPSCREQKGAAAEAQCPRLSLHPMGNEDQWGQDQVLSIGELPGDHPAITLKGQALEEVESFSRAGE